MCLHSCVQDDVPVWVRTKQHNDHYGMKRSAETSKLHADTFGTMFALDRK